MHLITLILLIFFGFFNSSSELETTYFVKDSFIYEIRNDSLFKISPDDYRIVSYSKLENYDNIDLLDYETLNYDSTYFYKKTGGLLYFGTYLDPLPKKDLVRGTTANWYC